MADDARCHIVGNVGSYQVAAFLDQVSGLEAEDIPLYKPDVRKTRQVFLKDRRYLMPLQTPPYYVIPGRVSIVVTHGGIKTNHRMEALDINEKVIPGLYASGTEIAGTSANTYNIFLSGHSFGFAINSGRIAGEEAAKYVL